MTTLDATSTRQMQGQRIAVVVLGDIGGSPRMQYHARSLAAHGAEVDVVAYAGHAPHPSLINHPQIRLHLLQPPDLRARHSLPRPLFLAYTALRVAWLSAALFWTLLYTIRRPQWLLIQNPPSLPTIALAWLAARARGSRLLIDWHNFGYAQLGMTIGMDHPLIRWARAYEFSAGRMADAHLCVSRAMGQQLTREAGILDVRIVYDRPAEIFHAPAEPQRQELRRELWSQLKISSKPADSLLAVSPTSWTADEDFSLLLDALRRVDASLVAIAGNVPTPPTLVMLLTGDGPRRAAFVEQVAAMDLRRVVVRTHWFEAEDYASFLGVADFGISLHRSASGVDLPIKVMDLFGSGVPVCGFDYGPCAAEQIQPGENGLLFATAAELAEEILSLSLDSTRLERLRNGARESGKIRWNDQWEREVLPVILPVG